MLLIEICLTLKLSPFMLPAIHDNDHILHLYTDCISLEIHLLMKEEKKLHVYLRFKRNFFPPSVNLVNKFRKYLNWILMTELICRFCAMF